MWHLYSKGELYFYVAFCSILLLFFGGVGEGVVCECVVVLFHFVVVYIKLT